jgi:hypothetical protein
MNTNKKSVNRSNNKTANRASKKSEVPYNYRPVRFGAIKFATASKAAVYMLTKTKFSQSEIARRLGVSQPCVCQLARDLK